MFRRSDYISRYFLFLEVLNNVIQISFLGIFYLGLARLYERTRDESIAQVIETSYLAMLSRVNFPSIRFYICLIFISIGSEWSISTFIDQ